VAKYNTPEEWRNAPAHERDAEIMHCRVMGWTLQAIADHVGYADASGVQKRIERIYVKTVKEPTEMVRDLEVRRLDEMLAIAWDLMKREYVAVAQGRVVRRRLLDSDGQFIVTGADAEGRPIYAEEEVADVMPVLHAMDRALKIADRRAKLLGLDAPKQVEVFTVDAVTAEIQRLEAELMNQGVNPETLGTE
jgi:hypothetical protein